MHTNSPRPDVIPGSILPGNVAASGVWADSLGRLAARFGATQQIPASGERPLTLSGVISDGRAFAAVDVVAVVKQP